MTVQIFIEKRKKADGSRGVYLKFRERNEYPFQVHTGITCWHDPEGCLFPREELNGRLKSLMEEESKQQLKNLFEKLGYTL